jgi:hypothetical protein
MCVISSAPHLGRWDTGIKDSITRSRWVTARSGGMIFGDDACRLVSWLLGSGGLIGSTSGFNLNDRAPPSIPPAVLWWARPAAVSIFLPAAVADRDPVATPIGDPEVASIPRRVDDPLRAPSCARISFFTDLANLPLRPPP